MSTNSLVNIKDFLISVVVRVVPLLLMGSLTLLSFWFLKKNTQEEIPPALRVKQHQPDYVFTNAKLTVLNPDGSTKYRLLGNEFMHYEDDAAIDVKQPKLRLFNPKAPPLTIVSNTAHITGDLAVVELFDHAVISRPAELGKTGVVVNPNLRLSSNYLKIFVNDDLMKTNLPTEIIRGDSVMMASRGATYNNIDQSVSMYGDVKGYISSSDLSKKN